MNKRPEACLEVPAAFRDLQVDDQLWLRHYGAVDDVDEVASLTLADKPYLIQTLDFLSDYSLEIAQRNTEFIDAMMRNGDLLEYRIMDGATVTGTVGVVRSDLRDRTASMGYYRYSSYEGQGIIRRTGPVIIGYAFDVMDIDTIELEILATNQASITVAKTLGAHMTDEKRLQTISGHTRLYDIWEITR